MSTRVTWLGHSALQIETHGLTLLIDPFFTDNPSATIKADDARADFILVSHGHGDHVGDAVAIAKRTGATVIANYEIATWLGKQGVANTHGMDWQAALLCVMCRLYGRRSLVESSVTYDYYCCDRRTSKRFD